MRALYLTAVVSALLVACGGGGNEKSTATSALPTAAPTAIPATGAETVAFLRDGDIWLIDSDGTNERRVTQLGGRGREVVSFAWLDKDHLSLRVEVAREPSTPPPSTFRAVLAATDGTMLWQRELPFDYTSGYLFSPDAELVAVWDSRHISLEEIAGGVLWESAVASSSGVSAAWRPDGQLLAIRDDPAVIVLDRSGHPVSATPLPQTAQLSYATFRGLSWSGDGRALAFVDGDDIVIISGEPFAEQRLTLLPGPPPAGCVADTSCRLVFGELVFAPDGQSLAVAVARALEIGAVGNANFVVYRIDLGPPLHQSRLFPASPDEKDFGSFPNMVFSPDGRWLAYSTWAHLSACEGSGWITVLHPDGRAARTFIPQEFADAQAAFTPAGPDSTRTWGAYVRGFQWLPTSDALVTAFEMIDCSYMGGEAGVTRDDITRARGVYLVRADDFSEVKLTADDASLSGLARSPSGRLAAYATGDQEQSTIRVLDVQTGQITDLGPGASPEWRPQD